MSYKFNPFTGTLDFVGERSSVPNEEVFTFPNFASFPSTGETGKLYIDESNKSVYYWDETISQYTKASTKTSWGSITSSTTISPGNYIITASNSFDINLNPDSEIGSSWYLADPALTISGFSVNLGDSSYLFNNPAGGYIDGPFVIDKPGANFEVVKIASNQYNIIIPAIGNIDPTVPEHVRQIPQGFNYGDLLVWNGSQWEVMNFQQLPTGQNIGEVLFWNGTNWTRDPSFIHTGSVTRISKTDGDESNISQFEVTISGMGYIDEQNGLTGNFSASRFGLSYQSNVYNLDFGRPQYPLPNSETGLNIVAVDQYGYFHYINKTDVLTQTGVTPGTYFFHHNEIDGNVESITVDEYGRITNISVFRGS